MVQQELEGSSAVMRDGDLHFRYNCRHYRGDVPCHTKRGCAGCKNFSAVGERILIIKLGALGDVLRTTPLLVPLKGQGANSEITWVTMPEAMELLEGNPLVDRVLPWEIETILRLEMERFDWVISLDKDPAACALATKANAARKSGFGLHPNGGIIPLDEKSIYALQMGIDDELKFKRNRKSYQQIIFEQAGMTYDGEPYILMLEERHRQWAQRRMEKLGLSGAAAPLGLAVGAGEAFANKSWPAQRWASFAQRAMDEWGWPVLLLVGPEERWLGKDIQGLIKGRRPPLSGGDHSLHEFAALIERCSAVVSGDTLAMHLAIAVGTPVVALFGPTCLQEVDFYGRGVGIRSPKSCSPCYRGWCDIRPTCTEEIQDHSVLGALTMLLKGDRETAKV